MYGEIEEVEITCKNLYSYFKDNIFLKHNHYAGRALTSDWFIHSFIMVLYDNLLVITIIKLCMDQSKVSALSAG